MYIPVITQVEIEFTLASYNLYHFRDLLLIAGVMELS